MVKKIFFNGCVFCIEKNVYEPAEDTFLAAENLVVGEKDIVLDMGTGCGILGILAAKRAKKVIAVDVNPHAVQCTKMNARLNEVFKKVDIRRGDLFSPIKKEERFDVIISNTPYLPSEIEEKETWINRAWDGGPNGRQFINRFISSAPSHLKAGGIILLVQSTLANVDETLNRLKERRLQTNVLAQKKVAFETLVLLQASRYSFPVTFSLYEANKHHLPERHTF